jgi:hypothetical protein
MTLYTPVLWFYAVMVSLVFGAFRAGSQGVALIVSTACAVAGVAWTLHIITYTVKYCRK